MWVAAQPSGDMHGPRQRSELYGYFWVHHAPRSRRRARRRSPCPSLGSSKLGGTGNIYHAKVSRGNRVTFFWEDDVIVVENHCHHDILKGYS